MTFAWLLVNARMVMADGNGFSAVALGWSHESDSAAVAPFVVPALRKNDTRAGGHTEV